MTMHVQSVLLVWLFLLVGFGTCAPTQDKVTLLLQVTDLHVSRFHHQDPVTSTSRVEDLEVFGDRCLRTWRPDAIVVTGDLTDAKSRSGRGEQYKAEWREYKRVWKKLAEASGLSEHQVFDIRGNHDVFDNVRAGPHDFFASFSARGARGMAADPAHTAYDRVYVDPVFPGQASARGQVAKSGRRALQSHTTHTSESHHITPEDDHASNEGQQQQHILQQQQQQRQYTAGSYGPCPADGPVGAVASQEQGAGRSVRSGSSGVSTRTPGDDSDQEAGGDLQLTVREQVYRGWTFIKRACKFAHELLGGDLLSYSGADSAASWATDDADVDTEEAGGQVASSSRGLKAVRAQYGGSEGAPLQAWVASVEDVGEQDDGSNNNDNDDNSDNDPRVSRDLMTAKRVGPASKTPPCPSVLLLGVDATPSLGLRNPTNFLGVVGPDLLAQLHEDLAQAHAGIQAARCPPPTIIAYGHHTLSCLAYGDAAVLGHARLSITGHQAAGRAAGDETGSGEQRALVPESRVEEVLSKWDVSAYLCGHLHDTFGLRVHRLHERQADTGTSRMAELMLADWKLSRWFRLMTVDPEAGMSFVDLQFIRDLNDQGDLEEPVKLLPADKSSSVQGHVVIITSPPDARYSFLAQHPSRPGSAVKSSNAVRVMLLPVLPEDGLEAGSSSAAVEVQLSWVCDRGTLMGRLEGRVELKPSNKQSWLYELSDLGDAPGIQECTDNLRIQVTVTEGDGGESRSARRPVRLPAVLDQLQFLLSMSPEAAPASKRRTSAGHTLSQTAAASQAAQLAEPQGMGLSLSEHAILTLELPLVGDYLFHFQWCLLVLVLLLIPRVFGHAILVIYSALLHMCFGTAARHREPSSLHSVNSTGPGGITHPSTSNSGSLTGQHSASISHNHSVGHHRSDSHAGRDYLGPAILSLPVLGAGSSTIPSPFTRVHPITWAVRAVVRPVAWTSRNCVARPVALLLLAVLWPLKDLARLATGYVDLWWGLMTYAMYLQFGPWFVGRFGSNIAGLGVMTAHGIWLPGPTGYTYHVLHDSCIITNVQMLTAVIPAVLWLASVVAYWSDQAASSKLGVAPFLSWRQVLALFVLVPVHCKLQAKMAVFYGASALLLGPSTGWLIPLAALWLRHARNRVIKARMD